MSKWSDLKRPLRQGNWREKEIDLQERKRRKATIVKTRVKYRSLEIQLTFRSASDVSIGKNSAYVTTSKQPSSGSGVMVFHQKVRKCLSITVC